MGKVAVAVAVAAALCCAVFWPVGGRSFWQRAEERGLQRAAARLAARGIRSAWDFVASLGSSAPAERAGPPHPPKRRALARGPVAASAPPPGRAAAPERGAAAQPAGPDRIVAQPPRETLQQSDRAALEKLLHAR